MYSKYYDNGMYVIGITYIVIDCYITIIITYICV